MKSLRRILLIGLAVLACTCQAEPLTSNDYTVASGSIANASWYGRNPGLGVLAIRWISSAGGILDATIDNVTGDIKRADFIPSASSALAPTNNYSATIENEVGGDFTGNDSNPLVAAVNLSGATRSSYFVALRTYDGVYGTATVLGKLSVRVAGAGSAKQGVVRIYVLRY